MSAVTTGGRGGIRRHGAAALAFAGLALFLTWPLATAAGAAIPGGGYGDNVTFLWNFWWMRQALASATAAAFSSAYLFQPAGIDLTLHTHTALGAWLGATVFRTLSVVTALDVYIWLCVALNGFCTYLFAWRLTRSRAAALVAGLFFAASPYFTGRLRGHVNLLGAWCLPAFWLGFTRALDERSSRAAIAAGLVLAAAPYIDYYYTVYLFVLAGCLLAVRWWRASLALSPPRPPRAIDRAILAGCVALAAVAVAIAATGGTVMTLFGRRLSMTSGFNLRTAACVLLIAWLWRRRRPAVRVTTMPAVDRMADLRLALIAIGIFVAAALPLISSAWKVWQRGDYTSQTYFWRSAPGGIDVATLAAGAPFHSLWGAVVQRVYAFGGIDVIESVAWFGFVPLLFLWSTRAAWRSEARGTVFVAAVFFLWALGPYLVVLGWNTGLYLPEILLRYVPVVANARIPGRAIVVVYLAVAAMLAVALAARPIGRRRRTAALLGLAIVLEFVALPLPLTRLDRPPFYQRLAAMPAGTVIDLPLGLRDGFGEEGALDHRTLYYQTLHGKPIAGGFVARLPESVKAVYHDTPFLRVMLGLSSGAEVSAADLAAARDSGELFARRHDMRYFVVNRRLANASLQAFIASLPWLRPADQDEERQLYVLQ